MLHPGANKPLSPKRVYERVKALGRRAGVGNAHPHRFRDTFAVDMLARGASPYDVAKLLGDTVSTIEKHYAPFVKELRDPRQTIHGEWRRFGEDFRHDLGTVAYHSETTAMKTKQFMADGPVSRMHSPCVDNRQLTGSVQLKSVNGVSFGTEVRTAVTIFVTLFRIYVSPTASFAQRPISNRRKRKNRMSEVHGGDTVASRH